MKYAGKDLSFPRVQFDITDKHLAWEQITKRDGKLRRIDGFRFIPGHSGFNQDLVIPRLFTAALTSGRLLRPTQVDDAHDLLMQPCQQWAKVLHTVELCCNCNLADDPHRVGEEGRLWVCR